MSEKKKGKRNKYSKEQIKFVVDLVKGGMDATPAAEKMCEEYGIKFNDSIGRLFRKKINDLGLSKAEPKIEDSEMFKDAAKYDFDNTKKRFIITWAQSYTGLNISFWENILAYAEKINAGVHVIAGRYKNPTSLEKSSKIKAVEKSSTPWAIELKGYLDANRQNLHKLVTVCSDVKIQPTAATPMSGFNGLTELESCIIGHPRVHLESLPVLDGYPNKFIMTTGSVTVPSYTDTKAGKKGEFHHQYGFVIVELDGEDFHTRQVQADEDGSFYDLDYFVNDGKVKRYNEKPLGMVFGDIHVGDHDPGAVEVSYEIAKRLKVKTIVLHDIYNGHSISHHEKHDPFILMKRELDGTNSLSGEIKSVTKWLKKEPDFDYVVVRSNHDDFLDRWLRSEDWRKNTNRYDYIKYAKIIADNKAPKGIIPYILEKKFKNVTALGINDSYRIGSFECGIHGHIGANGSRGSHIQYKNLNTKNITAHTHTPRRFDGHLSVGTLTYKRLDYNKGASSWAHANAIIYPNGKASHIFITNNYRFTTL